MNVPIVRVVERAAPREHVCDERCALLPGWWLHRHLDQVVALSATYDGRQAWGNGEAEPAQVHVFLANGTTRMMDFRTPSEARGFLQPLLRRLGLNAAQIPFVPVGVNHDDPKHDRSRCRACSPEQTAADDEAILLEAAFRSIARRDYALHFVRSAPALATLVGRKRVFDPALAQRLIAVYDDEIRAQDAQRNHLCRACKVNRGRHWHTFAAVGPGCDDPGCARPALRHAAYCRLCYGRRAHLDEWNRREARFRFLARRGATVPSRFVR